MKQLSHLSFIITFFAVCIYFPSKSQSVTIDPRDANPGSIIDATTTKKGFLMPRLTEVQRTAISSPVAGVQVYCTNCASGVGPYAYNGSVWVPMFNTASMMYAVGQAKLGGIVFYVDESGEHGLVVATADFNSGQSVPWISASNINTNAVRSGIYGGQDNTELINKAQGNGLSAALAAAQSTNGGYGDWYLPSQAELLLMYQNRASIGMGSVLNSYWSSTEIPAAYGLVSETANYLSFNGGGQGSVAKSTTLKVRAIRRF